MLLAKAPGRVRDPDRKAIPREASRDADARSMSRDALLLALRAPHTRSPPPPRPHARSPLASVAPTAAATTSPVRLPSAPGQIAAALVTSRLSSDQASRRAGSRHRPRTQA